MLVAVAALGASYLALAHYMGGLAVKAGVDADLVKQASVWTLLEARIESGWSISNHGSSGSDFSGTWAVGLVWLVEGLTVAGIGVAMGFAAAGEPYCEKCVQWTAGRKLILRGLTSADAQAALDAGGLTQVIGLTGPDGFDPNIGVELTVDSCGRCKNTGFLTVSSFQVVKKGKKTETVRKHLVKHVVLRVDELAAIIGRLDGLTAPAPVVDAVG